MEPNLQHLINLSYDFGGDLVLGGSKRSCIDIFQTGADSVGCFLMGSYQEKPNTR